MENKMKLLECPVCGSPLLRHELATDEQFECWDFYCNASIIRGPGGKLENNGDCREVRPLNDALDILNKASARAG